MCLLVARFIVFVVRGMDVGVGSATSSGRGPRQMTREGSMGVRWKIGDGGTLGLDCVPVGEWWREEFERLMDEGSKVGMPREWGPELRDPITPDV